MAAVNKQQISKQTNKTIKHKCHILMTNILRSRVAVSANSLQRPFSELQYLRRNFILSLAIISFVSVIPKKQRHSLITSRETVRKIFIKFSASLTSAFCDSCEP